jgi:hypothetical protein
MRRARAIIAAVMGAVAILSLAGASRAIAQDASQPAAAPPVKHRPAHAAAPPVRAIYVDEDTPWVLPPAPAPEVIETAGVLQCVPFARFISGIGLRGDAWTWWDKAAGIFARGTHPEPGAVLSFPGIERMPLGHVAVVTQVLSQRKILIDHANWPNAIVRHGAISRDIQVADVTPANDWSEVRVQFGEGGPLGSVYPANGFIYGWTETGVRIARPRFSLDYALWSPVAPSWRVYNAISYLWALPPAERKRAYAAAQAVPNPASSGRGTTVLVMKRPTSTVITATVTTTVHHLDAGGRAGFSIGRFVMQ